MKFVTIIYIMKEKHIRCSKYSRSFLQRTIETWQPYSSEGLSMEDGTEIAENIGGLFELLIALDEKYGKEENEI